VAGARRPAILQVGKGGQEAGGVQVHAIEVVARVGEAHVHETLAVGRNGRVERASHQVGDLSERIRGELQGVHVVDPGAVGAEIEPPAVGRELRGQLLGPVLSEAPGLSSGEVHEVEIPHAAPMPADERHLPTIG
jgi:hypothetical protein